MLSLSCIPGIQYSLPHGPGKFWNLGVLRLFLVASKTTILRLKILHTSSINMYGYMCDSIFELGACMKWLWFLIIGLKKGGAHAPPCLRACTSSLIRKCYDSNTALPLNYGRLVIASSPDCATLKTWEWPGDEANPVKGPDWIKEVSSFLWWYCTLFYTYSNNTHTHTHTHTRTFVCLWR